MNQKRMRWILTLLMLAVAFPTLADDTDIYGVASEGLQANVMIVLDTSGSMRYQDVDANPYDPNTTYPGDDYLPDGIYYWGTIKECVPVVKERCLEWGYRCVKPGRYYCQKWKYDCIGGWEEYTDEECTYYDGWVLLKDSSDNTYSLEDLECEDVRRELSEEGTAYSGFNLNDLSCDGSSRKLRMGNFLNYDKSGGGGEYKRRYEVAKEAIVSLLEGDSNARFGLMRFDSDGNANGGEVVHPCGTPKATIKATVEGYGYDDFKGGTPLSETLAEAGLYFAGQKGWFNGGNTYTSPIEQSCQKNYVIMVTDGAPSADTSSKLWLTPYINVTDDTNRYIGRYLYNSTNPEDKEEFYLNSNGAYYADPKTGYLSKSGRDTDGDGRITYNDRLSLVQTFESAGGSGTLFLDDIARYLSSNDIHSMETSGHKDQFVNTYTISFTIDPDKLSGQAKADSIAALDLLQKTATAGDGQYYNANSLSGLKDALDDIMSNIQEKNAIFAAPAVPTNKVRRTMGGEWIYFSYFKPQETGEWLGNIKKYILGNGKQMVLPDGRTLNSELNDVYGADLLSIYNRDADGNITGIRQGSRSFWTMVADGDDVKKGGAGEMLLNQGDNRNIYFLKSDNINLWEAENAFKPDNDVGISNTIINQVRKPFTDWKIGSIIHSSPHVVHYSDSQSLIFVGANDGLFHCFDDNTGKELWAFVPPGQEAKLYKLADSEKDYYVDGHIATFYGSLMADNTQLFQPEVLIFGERRGGSNYYALDISEMASNNDYTHVKYKYRIDEDILKGGDTDSPVNKLGQSWGRPVTCKASGGLTPDGKAVDMERVEDLFLFPGGYDTNQDSQTPASSDYKGRALFGVNSSTGTLSEHVNLNHINCSASQYGLAMNHSFVAFKAVSGYTDKSTNTDILTRLYAGDLGGYLFAFADDILVEPDGEGVVLNKKLPAGTFPTRKLLFSPTDGAPKKIFYAPGVASTKEKEYEWVAFGTGDITRPFYVPASGAQNRLYVIKNDWKTVVTNEETQLLDFTGHVWDPSDTEAAASLRNDIIADVNRVKTDDTIRGWYMDFNQSGFDGGVVTGEKLTSDIIIRDGIIYFTTYLPTSGTTSTTNPCDAGGAQGKGRLYSIYLESAIAVHDVNNDGKKEKPERWEETPPMGGIVVTDKGVISPAGSKEFPETKNYKYFYWRQN